MDKKRLFHSGEVWLEALREFGDELHGHVKGAEEDQLRFQNERLFWALSRAIKARVAGKEEWCGLFYCYRFMTSGPEFPGYSQARRLHREEMVARGLSSAGRYCGAVPKEFGRVVERKELVARVRSVAGWMEAQESFSLWLVFKDLRQGWRGDMDERARAIQAVYLARVPQGCLVRTTCGGREVLSARLPQGARIGTNYEAVPWTQGQWKNILRQAAGLVEKRFEATELERWVWWCYPVFRRYAWNTREVQEAAIRRGFTEVSDIYEANFRRRLMSMGLRISGRKQTRRARAPLAEFVEHAVLPDPETMWGALGGFLTKKK